MKRRQRARGRGHFALWLTVGEIVPGALSNASYRTWCGRTIPSKVSASSSMTWWGHDDLVVVIFVSLFTSKVKGHFLSLLSLCDFREMLFLSFAQLFLFGCLFLDIAKSNFSTWMQVFSDFPLVCFPRARFLKRTFFSFKVLPFVSGGTTDCNLKSDKAMCHPDFSCLSFSLSVSYMGLRKSEDARVCSSLWKEKSELQGGCRQFWELGGQQGHRPASLSAHTDGASF